MHAPPSNQYNGKADLQYCPPLGKHTVYGKRETMHASAFSCMHHLNANVLYALLTLAYALYTIISMFQC